MRFSSAALSPKLAAQKKAGAVDPLWLIADREPLLAQEAADAIRAAARAAGCSERRVLVLGAGSDWRQLAEAVGETSLFSERRIIEARLSAPSPGVRGAAALEQLAQTPLPGLCVMVSVPQADWRVAKTQWFRALAAAGNLVDCDPVARAQLPAWLGRRLKGEGLEATEEALRCLADQTEGNLLAAAQEIRKLALLHDSEGPVTLEEVEASVLDNSRYDVATVSTSAMLGDGARACRAIEGLRGEFTTSQVMPILLYTFSEDIRRMIALRSRLDQGENAQAAARELRIFPREKAAAVIAGAKRLSTAKLRNALVVCADIDQIYKGLEVPGRDSDPWIELKSVAAFLSR